MTENGRQLVVRRTRDLCLSLKSAIRSFHEEETALTAIEQTLAIAAGAVVLMAVIAFFNKTVIVNVTTKVTQLFGL